MNSPIPEFESARLLALHSLEIIDTEREESFDRVTRVISRMLDVPICLLSLIDDDREWFKASCGLDVTELPRDGTFCAYAIMNDEVMVVPDARLDPRFANRSSVTGYPGIRAYAGAPLRSSDGFNLGTICAIDTSPRTFNQAEISTLEEMSAIVVDLIEQRRAKEQLAKERKFIGGIIESVPALVYSLDRKGEYQFVNSQWEEWHKRSLEDVKGRHYRDIISTDILPQIEPLIQKAYNGQIVSEKIYMERARREAQLSYVPVFDDDNLVEGIVASAMDITRLREVERDLASREDELKQQAEVLQTALDSMNHAIAVWNADGQLQAWNPTFKEMGEFPDDMTVPGTDIRRFFFHAAAHGLLQGRAIRLSRLWDVANTPCKETAEISELKTGDGRTLSVWSKGRPEGGFVTMFLDVTRERSIRRVLTELHQISLGHEIPIAEKIEKMLRLGLEFFGLDIAIVTHISGDQCEIKYVQGEGALPDVGASFPLDQTFCARTIQADEPIAENYIKESAFANDPGYRTFGFEAYIGCSLLIEGVCDGTVNFVSNTPREHAFTENDRTIIRLFAQWCSTEIFRLRSEAELQFAKDRLIDAVESLPDAFILFDSDQKLALSNSKYLEFFPSAQEFLEPGTDVKELAKGLEQTFVVEPNDGRDLSRTMGAGQIQNLDDSSSGQVVQVSDGRWLSFSERRTGNGGLVGLCKDVTELISTQEELAQARDSAEAANQAKSEFLSSMSHELRTPMNSILGFGQLLDQDPRSPLDANQERYVGQILRSGNHLLHLIDEVLDLSRIELGNLDINSEVLNFDEILEECVSTAEALSASRGISIVAGASSPTPLKVCGDRVRTSQVLLNVLSNAIKYNRDDGRVTLEWETLPDGYLRISIADTGKGIPEMYRENVFQPFSRLPTNRDDTEGNGIGLALSKRLMENMQGRIDFTSVPDEGATFSLDFPLADLEDVDGTTVEFESAAPAIEADVAGSILYIEDNPANLELMEEIVRRISGVQLISAHTAEIGLTIARKDQPQLILMDINLPGMDGFEALDALKEDQRTQHIPIIALTANAMAADVEKGEQAGFYKYLTKPIKVAEVSQAIKEVLKTGHDPR